MHDLFTFQDQILGSTETSRCILTRAVKRLKCLIGLITGFCGLIMINHILPIFSVYFVRT